MELAFVAFLRHVCKAYLTEAAADSHRVLFEVLGERLRVRDVFDLVERTIQKVLMILKFWGTRDVAIYEELLGQEGLFWTLATGAAPRAPKWPLMIVFICRLFDVEADGQIAHG